MLTREEYISGAKERNIPEETINRVLETKFKTKAYSQPLEAKINDATGLFDIPLVGGLVRGVVNAGEGYGRMVGGAGYEAYRAGKSALGDTEAYVDKKGQVKQNPFLSEGDLKTFHDDPTEGLKRTGNMVLNTAMVANPVGLAKGGAKIAGSVIHPIKAMGGARSALLTGKTVPSSALDDAIRTIYEGGNFKFAPNLTQKAIQSQASKLRMGLEPITTGTKAYQGGGVLPTIGGSRNIPIDEVYKAIGALERGARAYGKNGEAGSTAIAQATNTISHVVRGYLKQQSPATVNALTKAMQASYKIGNNKGNIGKAAAGTLGAFITWKILEGALSKVGGEQ